ncbi:Armadillo repeat-containing protein 3 [Phytophthora oleae]|uniref:Armadillo repeat-containing protein 3 n=1 Tax=Phytophthora oleae TaxID=2107226 RepID=A0ABD3FBB0_9STRA
MISVVDLVVPGSGLIVDVLFKTAQLCSEMKEGQDACKRVHFRLNAIFEELQEMVKKRILPPSDKLNKYADVLLRYLQYLERYRQQNIAKRLIKHRAMMTELAVIHEDIETLFKMLNLAAVASMMDWKQQWEADRKAMNKVLESRTRSSVQVLREVPSVRAQSEAILDLKYELEQRCDRQNKEMIQLMEAMLKTVVQVSKSTVVKVPKWFLPSNEVYTDSEPFAAGSYGSVYRGKWGLGTTIIVKRFNVEDKVVSERAQRKIESEINIWYRLNHPHVIKMYGASHVSSPPFIVCEDATNGDLSDFLARSDDNFCQMWQLLYQAALGLEYIHSMDVVHGDLKLYNIFVASNGQAKLSDFGLSALRTCATLSKTSGESQSGGLRWRAPECLKKRPTFESDVYSFAMCMIEATTGEPPFSFLDDDSVRDNLKNGEIPDQPDEMSDEMWELVVSMTHVDPKKRLSLRDVIPKLKKFASNEEAPKKSVCGDCGCEIVDRAQFCLKCGAPTISTVTLSGVCSTCGCELSDEARFCSTCGTLVPLSPTTSENYPVVDLDRAKTQTVSKESLLPSVQGAPEFFEDHERYQAWRDDPPLDVCDIVDDESTFTKIKRFVGFGTGTWSDKVDVELLQPEPSLLSDSAVIASRVPRHQVKV